jgi:hypothetical protein
MNIEIASHELIDALSDRLAKVTVELETTKLALTKTQEALATQIEENMSLRAPTLPEVIAPINPAGVPLASESTPSA